jgi:membrane associated rhomboid family serine protease
MSGSHSITKSWVFRLIVINCLIHVLQIVYGQSYPQNFPGALYPSQVLQGKVWQIFTYMFLHRDFWHLFMNMFGLFTFGIVLEDIWGSRKFIVYYLLCGVGAGIAIFLIGFFNGSSIGGIQGLPFEVGTIGASGSIFGLLLAFAIIFPEAELLFLFAIPMKAKMAVIVFGSFELIMELTGAMGSISHIGHLGGLVTGILYFALYEKRRIVKRKPFIASVVSEKPRATAGLESGIEQTQQSKNLQLKKDILQKLEQGGGLDSLSDDEYQFIRYIDILTESGSVVLTKVFDLTDDNISDKSFIERVKKYISF